MGEDASDQSQIFNFSSIIQVNLKLLRLELIHQKRR